VLAPYKGRFDAVVKACQVCQNLSYAFRVLGAIHLDAIDRAASSKEFMIMSRCEEVSIYKKRDYLEHLVVGMWIFPESNGQCLKKGII